MKRLLVAFGVALSVHLLIFNLTFKWTPDLPAPQQPITLDLTAFPKPPAPKNTQPEPRIQPPEPSIPESVPAPASLKPTPQPLPPKPKTRPMPKLTPLAPAPMSEPLPTPPLPKPRTPAPVLPPSIASTQPPEPKHQQPIPPTPLPEPTIQNTIPSAQLPAPSQPPRFRQTFKPLYPRLAKRRGYQGTVIIEAHISEKGRVLDLHILQSSGHPSLDKSARQSVRTWQFDPALELGKPVAQWVRVPIDFKLE